MNPILIIGAGLAGVDSLAISLATGEVIAASCVLSAIGLKADTALALAAGLAVDRAIVVNRHLETSVASVYALGDSAQYASAVSPLSAHGSTLPYVMPIMSAAKALAANLTGLPTDLVFPLMPISVKTPALPLVVAPPKPGGRTDSGRRRNPAFGNGWTPPVCNAALCWPARRRPSAWRSPGG